MFNEILVKPDWWWTRDTPFDCIQMIKTWTVSYKKVEADVIGASPPPPGGRLVTAVSRPGQSQDVAPLRSPSTPDRNTPPNCAGTHGEWGRHSPAGVLIHSRGNQWIETREVRHTHTERRRNFSFLCVSGDGFEGQLNRHFLVLDEVSGIWYV